MFVVKDNALPGKLKAGDKVKFVAINDAGNFPSPKSSRPRELGRSAKP